MYRRLDIGAHKTNVLQCPILELVQMNGRRVTVGPARDPLQAGDEDPAEPARFLGGHRRDQG